MTERPMREEADEENPDQLWDDFWKNDRLDTLWWALVFIWAGLVLLAETSGFAESIAWWDGWSVFFIGAGGLVLLGTLLRLALPAYRRKISETLIFGLILLAIGLGNFWVGIWPLALILVGLVILRGVFARRR